MTDPFQHPEYDSDEELLHQKEQIIRPTKPYEIPGQPPPVPEPLKWWQLRARVRRWVATLLGYP